MSMWGKQGELGCEQRHAHANVWTGGHD